VAPADPTTASADPSDLNVPPDDPSATPAGPTAIADRDGVRVTLTLDRATLPAGDRTLASVSVENGTLERRLWSGGGCNFLATITVATAAPVMPVAGRKWNGIAGSFKDLLLVPPEASSEGVFVDQRFAGAPHVACTMELSVNELSAGQRLEMLASWNGEVGGVTAAPGPARVTASFPYLGPAVGGDPLARPVQPIEASVDVVVADTSVRLLSPGEAIDAALGNPQFVDWLTASGPMRTWDGVDLEASGHTFVVILMAGGQQGRASVDRATGAVSFEQRAR
jgi:hypothetical protein